MPRVNLVPLAERQRELRRRLFIIPVAGAAILLIAMGMTYVYFDRQIANTQQELQDLKQNNANLAPQVKELEAYQEKQDEKQERLTSVIALYAQRIRWSRILDDLAFVIPEDVSLVKIDGVVPSLVIKKDRNVTDTRANDLVIEGDTTDMSTIAVLLVRLGLIPGLTGVNLITAEKEDADGGGWLIHFEVGADLAQIGEVQAPAAAPSTGEDGPSEGTSTNDRTTTTDSDTNRTTGTSTSRTSTGRTSTTSTSTGLTSTDDEEYE